MTETREMLAMCEIVTIPVGHWIHQEETAGFLEAVRPFLERHS